MPGSLSGYSPPLLPLPTKASISIEVRPVAFIEVNATDLSELVEAAPCPSSENQI